MSIKLKTLSAAVGLVMGTAAINANADALLFPYFQSGNGAYTFLSLHSDAGQGAPSNPGDPVAAGVDPFTTNRLHYVWNYNDPTFGECTHYDAFGSMSQFDVIQQTVVSPSSPGGVDLDAAFNDASFPAYLNATTTTRGFLTVSDNYMSGYVTGNEAGFRGQAIVVDAIAGTVSAYKGLNDITNTYEGDFSSIFTSALSHDLTWYPTARVNTSWFALVTGRPVTTAAPYADPVDLNPAGMANPSGWRGVRAFRNGFGGVFDRDEGFYSFNRPFNVTCYRVIDRAEFMNASQLIATAEGGYNWLINAAVNSDLDAADDGLQGDGNTDVSGATGAILVKIESTTALGGTRTAISWENAYPNLPY